MANGDSATIHPNDLEAFCVAALCKAGLSEDDAKLTAKVFVTTDTWGTFTHGSRQIRGLLKNARSGRLKLEAREKIVAEGRTTAVFPIREYWLDVGRIDDLEQARQEFDTVFGR